MNFPLYVRITVRRFDDRLGKYRCLDVSLLPVAAVGHSRQGAQLERLTVASHWLSSAGVARQRIIVRQLGVDEGRFREKLRVIARQKPKDEPKPKKN
jgi:hypothetical protein